MQNLNLTNVTSAKNIEYISLLLEEENPNLQVKGVDFLSEKALEIFKKRKEEEQKQMEETLKNLDVNNQRFAKYLKDRNEYATKRDSQEFLPN